MLRNKLIAAIATLVLLHVGSYARTQNQNANAAPAPTAAQFKNSGAPLSFIENKGQVTDQNNNPRNDVQFKVASGQGLSVFIGAGAIHYQFSKAEGETKQPTPEDRINPDYKPEPQNYSMYRMDVTLIGANTHAQVITEGKQDYCEHYYTEHTGEKGATAYAYSKITYKDIYPGIDWVLYTHNGQLKHEFVVRQCGKVSDIQLQYGGATDVQLGANGDLVATTPQGTIMEQAPSSYEIGGSAVASKFVLNKAQSNSSIVSYQTGNYSGALVIDPALVWGTYFGGSTVEYVYGTATNGYGEVYLTGETYSTTNIATSGAYQTVVGGGYDAFLAKFSSSGALLWATYYGGTGTDVANGVCVDGSGNVYIVGQTSADLPVPGAYQTVSGGGGNDGFLAKFSNGGVLQWATYYGGSNADIAEGVSADGSGNIYIVGYTQSTSISTVGAYQTGLAGVQDVFLAKFTNAGSLAWATYYGGFGGEYGQSVATDNSGNVYITGQTTSSTGIATAGAYQATIGSSGTLDAFLAKFSSSGALQWATYFGGGNLEYGSGVATADSGNVYITGFTQSATGIATTGAHQATYAGASDGFLAKFTSAGGLQWASYYGGSGTDQARGISVKGGHVYVVGNSSSASGIATTGAYQATFGGGIDAFLAQFSNGGILLWATYYGGANGDYAIGVSTDDLGNTYVAGQTVTPGSGLATTGAYQTAFAGGWDGFLAKFCLSISGTLTLCPGAISTLSSGPGGTWSSSNTSIATIDSSGVVTGVSTGTAVISCVFSGVVATAVVTVNGLPNAGTITGSSSVCMSANTTLADAATGGAWSTSATGIATVGSTGIVTGASSGTATISYTVTNSCGTATATRVITVNTLPNAGTITGPSTICAGSSMLLTDATAGGTWSSSAPGIATVSAGAVTGVAAGTTVISYTVANGCGAAAATQTVTVNSSFIGPIMGYSEVCLGATASLEDITPGGTWSSSSPGVASVGSTGILSGVAAGSATISYTVVSGCGSVTTTKAVSINPVASVAAITGLSSVCTGAMIAMTDPTAGGVWSALIGHASVSTSGTVSGVSAGVDTVQYTLVNSCGTFVASKAVTVNLSPNAGAITGASTVCQGASITLSNSSTGGAWSATNATATVSGAGIVAGVAAGTDTVVYTVTNICGTATARKVVTINATPVVGAITGSSSVCVGSSMTLGAVGGGTWSATNGHATVIGGGVHGVSAGADTIVYHITNSCGTATATKVVTVNPPPSAGSIMGASSVCVAVATTLTNTSAGGTWSATNSHAMIGSASGIVTGMIVGVDTLIYTVAMACGTATTTKVVTVNPLPYPGAISGPSTVCVGALVTLSDSVAGGVWAESGTSAAIAGNVVAGVSGGVATVSYGITNICGTLWTMHLVTVNPLPDAGILTGPSFVCVGGTATLSGMGAGGTWTTANPNLTVAGGVITGMTAGADTITYTVTTSCGTNAASKIIDIEPLPYAGAITGADTICIGGATTLADAIAGGAWTAVTGASSVSPAGVVHGINPGADTIHYSVVNTCGTAVASHAVFIKSWGACNAGVNAVDPLGGIYTVPNPNNGSFEIRGIVDAGNEPVTIEITDMAGRVVYMKHANPNGNTIDEQVTLSKTVASGMYLVTVRCAAEIKVFHVAVSQ